MDRDDAQRLAHTLRDLLRSTASPELLDRLADRGGLKVGLNPPDELEDEELTELVGQALRRTGLAGDR
jgi:hypothetical protein